METALAHIPYIIYRLTTTKSPAAAASMHYANSARTISPYTYSIPLEHNTFQSRIERLRGMAGVET